MDNPQKKALCETNAKADVKSAKKIEEIREAVDRFISLAQELGHPVSKADLAFDSSHLHEQPVLPKNHCAVYIFLYQGKVLKIGKANAKSGDRYRHQHYRFDVGSTLAKSLFKDDSEFKSLIGSKENAKSWMLANLVRVNVLINDLERNGKAISELLEALLHYQFRPRFEGAIR